MKRLFAAVLALSVGLSGLQAADPKVELESLVSKVKTRLQAGAKTEADLAAELKEFDSLLAAHKGEKTDAVAEILLMKAMLYLEVFQDSPKGTELVKQLKADFPETKLGKQSDQILANIAQQAEVQKIQENLAVGKPFPDFNEKDLQGRPLSISGLKGKVVLVDFWATWCGPCVGELPAVRAVYEKYHPKGLEIVGISLDKDQKQLTRFLEKEKMTWPQYFDGLGWSNKLAKQYGISSIPATFLLDQEGKIIARDLRGEELEQAVAKALP